MRSCLGSQLTLPAQTSVDAFPIALGHTFLSRTRTVSVFDCIYAISQHGPQNTPFFGQIRISYVNGILYVYWRKIRHIWGSNPIYVGVKPNICWCETQYRMKVYIFWHETLYWVKLSTFNLANKPEQL